MLISRLQPTTCLTSALTRWVRPFALVCAATAAIGLAQAHAQTTITVNTEQDELSPSSCSLRAAFASVNAGAAQYGCTFGGAGVTYQINFDAVVNTITLTIPPGATNNDNADGDLDLIMPTKVVISGPITIRGPITWTDRLIDVLTGTLELEEVTLEGGNVLSTTADDLSGFNSFTTTLIGACEAAGGGAVRALAKQQAGEARLVLNSSTIRDSRADGDGGGICSIGGMVLNASEVISNTAQGNGGGIFLLARDANITNTSLISGNLALGDGGGAYFSSTVAYTSSFGINDSRFVANKADGGSGGGIFVARGDGAGGSIVGGDITDNRANQHGGGIYNESGMGVSASEIRENQALNGDGGGIYSAGNMGINDTTIAENQAANGGGGIYNRATVTGTAGMYVGASNILTNTAGLGGGAYNDVRGSTAISGNITFDNVRIAANQAITDGGGAYNNGNWIGLQNGSRVENNQAGRHGGGLYQDGNWATVNSAVLASNTAGADGGGVYVAVGSQMELDSASVLTNTAQRGGGLHVAGNGVNLSNVNFQSNLATADGGGVYHAGFWSNVQFITLTANQAQSGHGGGLYLALQSGSTMTNVVAVSNTAAVNGGGAYVGMPGITFVGSQFVSNTAQNGGGIYVVIGTLTLDNADVENNSATQHGGGVYNAGSYLLITATTQVRSNTAQQDGGGVYQAGVWSDIQDNSVIASNQAQRGGGIFVATGMRLNTISVLSNTAQNGGGVYHGGSSTLEVINASLLRNNVASVGGGGLFISGTYALLNSSDVISNQAAEGGGIYVVTSLDFSRAQVLSNTATSGEGGGAFVNSGSFRGDHSSFIANNGDGLRAIAGYAQISNTTWSGNAGHGVFVTGTAYVSLTHTTIASNTLIGISANGNGAGVFASILAYNAGGDCAGSNFYNEGYNLTSDGTCGLTAANPLLGPLTGAPAYHPLPSNSPALNQVPAAACWVGDDQRFLARPQGSGCDSGAFELEAADLSLSKSAEPMVVMPGDTITYTIAVTNNTAGVTATNVVITDLLSGATFGGVVSSGGAAVSSAANAVTFTLSQLGGGSSVTIIYTAIAGNISPITNSATVSAVGTDDPNGGNDGGGALVMLQADLSLSKSAQPTVVAPGETITYTIVVTNNTAGVTATNVVITDLLSGASFGGVVSSGGAAVSSAANAVTFTLSQLGGGSSVTIIYTATAGSSSPITNNALIASPGISETAPGDEAGQATVLLFASLSLSKSAQPTAVMPGDTITYTIVVTNNTAGVTATNVVITDLLSGASFGGVVSSGGAAVSSAANAVTFTLSQLGGGSSVTIIYTATAGNSSPIINSATVSATNAANSASSQTVVLLQADLSLSKSAQPTVVAPGETITYTIAVTNNTAGVTATNVVITDLLSGASFGGVVSSGGAAVSSAANAVTFTLSQLGGGNSVTIIYTATAGSDPVITNLARISSPDVSDTDNGNNSGGVSVSGTVSFSITKSQVYVAGPGNTALPNTPITYTIAVTNNGPSNASVVTVTDTLPGGMTPSNITAPSGWSCSSVGSTVTCTAPMLTAGASANIQIVATVPMTGGLVLTNTASVASASPSVAPTSSDPVSVQVTYRLYLPIVRRSS